MTRQDALRLLRLTDDDLDAATIRSAFRHAAFRFHPDTTPMVSEVADFDKLRSARDLLLSLTKSLHKACKLCHGRGKVPGRLGAVTCGACGGTGETR